MLLIREKKILELLMGSEEKVTTTQIAASLKVSSRTIKTDIKKINLELENHGCSIQSQQGVGIWLEYDEQGEKYLISMIRDDKDDFNLSPDIRKFHLAVELLFQEDYTSMEALAGRYFISKATVLNDLSELDEFWNKFNIHFIKKVKYGIKVEGSEGQIRAALIEALKRAAGKDKVNVENIRQHFPDVDFEALREILYQMEARFQFVITDVSLEELLIALAVMYKRIRQGKIIDPGTVVGQVDYGRMNYVLSYLKKRLSEIFRIYIPEEEDIFLKICINGLRFHIPMNKENTLEEKRQRNPEMFDFIVQLLDECDRKFSLNLKKDRELTGSLMDHLECMILRLSSNLYTYNPILKTIKNELFYEYEIASYFMTKFSKKYEIAPTEDEIGFIAFHIGTSLERMKQKQSEKIPVSIVCTTGFGTSQFLKVKLGSYFPNLDIKHIISAARLSQVRPEDQEFIIATVPVETKDIPVIQISPVLKDSDIKKIQDFLLYKKENISRISGKYKNLNSFLHNEITILGCDLKNRQEAINLLGSRMISEGYTDEGFVASVFEREKLSETAVGSLIAIPHAYEGHVKKQGIGILTLKKPIDWGDEKVQIVLMLSLDAASEDDIKDIFTDVFELTKDKKRVEMILRSQKFTDLIR